MEDREEIYPFICGLCYSKYNQIHLFYDHFLSHDLDTSWCFHLCSEDNASSSLTEIQPEHASNHSDEHFNKEKDTHTDRCENEPERIEGQEPGVERQNEEKSNEEADKFGADEIHISENNVKGVHENNDSDTNSNETPNERASTDPGNAKNHIPKEQDNASAEHFDSSCKEKDPDVVKDVSTKSNPQDNWNDFYTCSICSYTFPTICTLHNHLSGCASRGSYSFDNDTKLAYPLNNECSFFNLNTNNDDNTLPNAMEHSTEPTVLKKKPLRAPKTPPLRERRKRKPKILEDFVMAVKQEPGDPAGKMYMVTHDQAYDEFNMKGNDGTSTDEYEPSPEKKAGKLNDDLNQNTALHVPPNGEKRKRGRPRKSTIEHPDDGDQSKNKPLNLNDNVNLGTLKNGGKKKRGRRKKSKVADIQNDGENDQNNSADHEGDHEGDSVESITSKFMLDNDIDTSDLGDDGLFEYIIENGVKIGVKLKRRNKQPKRKRIRPAKIRVEQSDGAVKKRSRRSDNFWGEGKKGCDEIACTICQKKFMRYRMDYHMISHSDVRRFKCEVCEKSFKYFGHLREHKLVHSDGTPYICEICGSGHRHKVDLKFHMMRHRGERPARCDVCGLSFRTMNGLNRHLLIHSEKKDYTCDQCGRSFRRKDFLSQHLRIHKKEKRHMCTDCDKSFYTNYQLTCHVMTHTGERPNTCSVCGIGYIQRKELRKHMKHRHNHILEPTVKTNIKDYNAMVEGALLEKKTLIKEDVDYQFTTPVRHFKNTRKRAGPAQSEADYVMFEYDDVKSTVSLKEQMNKKKMMNDDNLDEMERKFLDNSNVYSAIPTKAEGSVNMYEDSGYGMVVSHEEQDNAVAGIVASNAEPNKAITELSTVLGIGTQLESQVQGIGTQLESEIRSSDTHLESQTRGIGTPLESGTRGAGADLNLPLNLATEQSDSGVVDVGYQGVGNEIQVYYGNYTG